MTLQTKITEKETQIEEVSRKIDAITKELQSKGQKTSLTAASSGNGTGKKAVRIQEPEVMTSHSHLDVIHIDPVSDSGYTSTTTTKTTHVSDMESSFI